MKSLNRKWITAALVGTACLLTVGTTQAAQFILRADTTTKTMPDGRTVPMWGFAQDSTFGSLNGVVTVPGPAIVVPPNDAALRIVLDNRLPEGVSLVIPGLPPPTVTIASGPQNGTILQHTRFTPDGDDRDRARSLVAETPPQNQFPGSTARILVRYEWSSVPPGTYLYHSGSHVALQVQMGLYGSIRRRSGANEAYAGVPFNQNLDVTLLFSEVDADLHDAVAAGQYGPGLQVPSTIHSGPQYYLINGNAYDPANPNASLIALAGRPTLARPALLRLLNAGQDMRVPIIDRSELRIIAEDARLSAYPKTRYSVQLPALKTVDALWAQTAPGTHALYDRRLGLSNNQQPSGGMLVNLRVP